jgi:hypothetical protein
MRGEFERYVDAVLSRRGATLVDLLTSAFTFVDPTLATFYGMTPDGAADAQGFRRVSTLEPQRLGVLGLGAVQATHARPNASSPVHRGRLVRERLLCQPLPPPPPGVNAQPPAPDPSRTVREQYAMHASVRPCVDCHRLIDPIGFTFEFFDGVGRYRATEAGRAIDGRGEVVGSRSSDRVVADGRALVAHLAASAEVHDCFARQLFRYAYASAAGEQTACALAEVQARFRASNLSVDELFVALARSIHFTQREGAAAPVTPMADAGVADAAADAAVTPDAAADAGRDAAAPMPDAAVTGPTTTPGVTTMTVRDSTWDAGFCERVIVMNGTGAPVDWTVVHTIAGTVTTSWNSERTGDSGAVVFRGAMWNRTLAPGARTELGFCALRGGPAPAPGRAPGRRCAAAGAPPTGGCGPWASRWRSRARRRPRPRSKPVAMTVTLIMSRMSGLITEPKMMLASSLAVSMIMVAASLTSERRMSGPPMKLMRMPVAPSTFMLSRSGELMAARRRPSRGGRPCRSRFP